MSSSTKKDKKRTCLSKEQGDALRNLRSSATALKLYNLTSGKISGDELAEKLLEICGEKYNRKRVSAWEKGTEALPAPAFDAYTKIFGEEFTKIFQTTYFSSDKISSPMRYHDGSRSAELEQLNKMLNNDIIVICAEAGRGKTTLAKKFIEAVHNQFSLCRNMVIKANPAGIITFSESCFAGLLFEKITIFGTSAYDSQYERDKQTIETKINFVRDYFKRDESPKALFLIDDLDSLSLSNLKLLQERYYKNCKFIVTTRVVTDTFDHSDDYVLNLDAFNEEMALDIFDYFIRMSRNNKGLSDKERTLFKEVLYPFSEGNAELIYFMSIIFKASSSFNAENIIDRLKNTTFKAEVSRNDSMTVDPDKSERLALKLNRLFDLSNGFLPDFNTANMDIINIEAKKLKALAVLSITGMKGVKEEALSLFLSQEENDFNDVAEALDNLFQKGFIDFDGEKYIMHSLMSMALELNKIDEIYTDEIKLFAYCTTCDDSLVDSLDLKSIKNIKIPKGIKEVTARFYWDIESMEFSQGVKSTMPHNLGNIERIIVNEENKNLTSIDGNLYSKDGKLLIRYAPGKKDSHFIIPNGVTSIEGLAFKNCVSLTSITIPDSVTSIGYYAFDGCKSLKSITIGDGVTSIGWGVFSDCTSLTSITIPGSVTSIGDYAFYGCTSLTSITIPSSITSIGDYAFNYCTSLTSVTIPGSVTSIGDYAFNYCTSLTSVTIPGSVTSIGDYAFWACTSLTSITIGDGVTSIGWDAFKSCTSLTSITIPSSVTSIGYYAFKGCTSLTSITIGDGVTSIEKG
ncbi:MAG: leucine-rich repeat domain-containing protein, partial [Clostridia bacterium]|nr:leucine-rich repeat domain-containing protein [Clostridia bacterium]